VHAGLQDSTCSGYDLCDTYRYTDIFGQLYY